MCFVPINLGHAMSNELRVHCGKQFLAPLALHWTEIWIFLFQILMRDMFKAFVTREYFFQIRAWNGIRTSCMPHSGKRSHLSSFV